MEVIDEQLSLYLEDRNDRSYEGFSDFFCECLDNLGISTADFVRKCRIERTYVYQILKGMRNPGREKIIIMCIAAGLSFTMTQKALVIAKAGILYYRDDRDAVIIYAVNHGLDLVDTNALLEKNGFTELN